MGLIALLLLAVALSMDAFTVAICKGLAMKNITLFKTMVVGGYFGSFQAIMPLLGYLLGRRFEHYIVLFDHWIAFFLLAVIGLNMVKSSFREHTDEEDGSLQVKNMLLLSIATSIDAMAVGVAFAFLEVDILFAVLLIGIITFVNSFIGVRIGNYIGNRFQKIAELIGGFTLIGLGMKILLEGLGII